METLDILVQCKNRPIRLEALHISQVRRSNMSFTQTDNRQKGRKTDMINSICHGHIHGGAQELN
jgi:hypothetical protein